jgi:hypothetical protein
VLKRGECDSFGRKKSCVKARRMRRSCWGCCLVRRERSWGITGVLVGSVGPQYRLAVFRGN